MNLQTLKLDRSVETLLELALMTPVQDFLSRPGKKIRTQIVELGYAFSDTRVAAGPLSPTEKVLCEKAAELLETLHAGSLVIDDIQDGSRIRRGKPSLHVTYGLPVALNAGNWMYFWPLQKIGALGVSDKTELALYRLFNDVMLKAHYGQALDVGIRIDEVPQENVFKLCMSSIELKSGALMSLAISLGATLAQASPERIGVLQDFGNSFGTALQMYDDIGNFCAAPSKEPLDYTKRFEDLYLRRPSWIWAVAATECTSQVYQALVDAVWRLPDESFLKPWIEIHQIVPKSKARAKAHLSKCLDGLNHHLPPEPTSSGFVQLRELSSFLERVYV